MKKLLVTMVAVLAIVSTDVFADASKSSPLVGAWSVDVSRLPIPAEQRPKSVTITFKDGADGKWVTQVRVIAADGKESHADALSSLDGAVSPVIGNLEADASAVKMPMPNVLVMMLMRQSVPASTRVYAVSADGQSMIETACYFDKQGNPVMRTNYFKRIK
ncbi:MAG TPA: hypothetical protein VG962_11745 [Steroidobacteraceae bacterium]|nr:hypothetical protein [Steroidobacteraceae bacterium]